MILILEITGPQAGAPGSQSRKIFQDAGGTIGRLPNNDVVLADDYVSGTHAIIQHKAGVFYIEDRSRNGVFINSPDHRLAKGVPYALRSGDLILIEPYEISAAITSAPESPAASPFSDPFPPGRSGASPPAYDRFAPERPFEQERPSTPSGSVMAPGPLPPDFADASGGEEVDPLRLLGIAAPHNVKSGPSPRSFAHGSVLNDDYRPPAEVSPPPPSLPPQQGGLIPDDYDPLASEYRPAAGPRVVPERQPRPNESPAPEPALPVAPLKPRPEAPVPPDAAVASPFVDASSRAAPERERGRAAMTSGDHPTLADVLAGAGIETAQVTPDLARDFGRILRVVVAGLMDALHVRRRIKAEFRIGTTVFTPTANNPLKFSVNVDDALHNLLVKRNSAYLPPVEAFQDAFDDVRNHQMAMLEGVRVAFASMLAEFDPDRLQEDFDQQVKKGGLLSVPAKLRYWDLYREKIHDMVKDSDATFRALFGDEFATAYEAQLKRLKAQKRSEEA